MTKRAEKPRFEGVLNKPMPSRLSLLPVSEAERGQMLAERVAALFERYKLTPSDPKSGIVADDWMRLAAALALEFIPGFEDVEPWMKQRGPGAPPKRTDIDWLEFLADVYALQKRTGLKSVSQAVALTAKESPWKKRGFTYRRSNEFKRDSKWWKMIPEAAGYQSLTTGVDVSVEGYVINMFGRKSSP